MKMKKIHSDKAKLTLPEEILKTVLLTKAGRVYNYYEKTIFFFLGIHNTYLIFKKVCKHIDVYVHTQAHFYIHIFIYMKYLGSYLLPSI